MSFKFIKDWRFTSLLLTEILKFGNCTGKKAEKLDDEMNKAQDKNAQGWLVRAVEIEFSVLKNLN